MYKIVSIFFLVLVLYVSEIEAYVISKEELSQNFLVIQTGAFSKKEGAFRQVEKLKKYPVLVEKEGDLTRVFVVISPSKSRFILKKIRKIVPDAYVKRGYAKHLKTLPFQTEDEVNENEILDSKAILRTRKKFF